MNLHNVRRVTNVYDQIIKHGRGIRVGDYAAKEGAWHRKYQIVRTNLHSQVTTHMLRTGFCGRQEPVVGRLLVMEFLNLGSYYADGRRIPAKRTNITHQTAVIKLDGELVTENNAIVPVVSI